MVMNAVYISLQKKKSLTRAAEKEGSHDDELVVHFKSPLLGIKSEVKLREAGTIIRQRSAHELSIRAFFGR